MPLKVIGDRVLIKPKPLKSEHEVDGTKIKLAISYGTDEKMHKMASQEGTVVDIGSEAWSDYENPWCVIGDEVVFAQYAGKFVTDPETKENYIVINDIDIQVVITREST